MKTTTPKTDQLRQKDKERLKSKSWRVSHFYKIRNKKKELVTFKPNAAQAHFEKHRHTRNIILKSRQLGFTTYEAIDMLDDTLHVKNFEGLLIADDLEVARDIFDNKIKLGWENFPLQHLYSSDLNSARKIKIDFGDKTYSSITVDNSGRAGTYNRIHVSEFAKLCKMYPERAKEVLEGSIPAVPTDGRVDIESTAQESEGLFYDLFWDAWERGEPKHKTQFKAHFYNWQWDPEVAETEPITDLPAEFRAYQVRYKLSDKEISYYYLKYLSLGDNERNWATMKKEFPTTPEEAFEGSGTKLFDLEKVGLLEKIDPIKQIGNFIIYKPYKLGHSYGMGVDVAEGVGQDSSTIVLWDFTPAKPEVVAEYANNMIAPDLFAFEIKNLAEKYEMPLVAIERNNHGHTTISKLREIYPERHIYQDEKEKFGWLTNMVSKPKMLFEMSAAVNDELINVYSSRIMSEMRRIDREDLRVIHGSDEATKHWDLLMAASIGFQLRYNTGLVRRKKKTSTSSSGAARGKGIRGV